jgi:hypothetical protein
MEKFNWTYIGALLSVGFGWFLNELGQWFRTRKEDRKTKKQVLFYLLEIHFTFNKFDTSEITNLLSRKVLERIPKNEQTEEAKEYINQFYNGMIGSFVEDNVAESLAETEEHYTKSIKELSKLDPITAYRLNGKNKIFQVFDLLHDYYDEVKETFPNEPGLNEQIELTVETIKPEIIKDAISDLEDEIRGIALSINLWTWCRARRTVNNTKTKIRKDDEKKIDEMLNMVMPKMT